MIRTWFNIFKIFPIFLLFLVVLNTAHAQSRFVKGFVVTHERETLYGLVKIKKSAANLKVIEFMQSQDSLKIQYDAYSLYAFHNGIDIFISKDIPMFNDSLAFPKKVFLKLLVSGRVDLYEYEGQNSAKRFFIEKDSLQLKELYEEEKLFNDGSGRTYIFKSYVGILNMLLIDFPELERKKAEQKFTSKNLIDLISRYNNKFAPKDIDKILDRIPKEKKIGVFIGLNLSNFINSEAPQKYYDDGHYNLISSSNVRFLPHYSFDGGYYSYNYKTNVVKDIKTGLSFGINYEYQLSQRLYLKSSLSFDSKGINIRSKPSLREISDNGLNYHSEEKFERRISNDYITFQIILKRIFQGKYRPFIAGGIYYGYLLQSEIYAFDSNDSYIWERDRNLNTRQTLIDNEKDLRKEYTSLMDVGVSVGTGFTYTFSERLFYNTELIINLGLIKIDGNYNNQYDGNPASHRSYNYFGLNSNAKNLNMGLRMGLSYRLRK